MRLYVLVAPWWPSLSCASLSAVYFQNFGMTRAKNFWFESMTCLYSNPLMCRKRSVSCFGAFPLHRHLEICLQNGSILCICSRACSPSSVSEFWHGIWYVCDCGNMWHDSICFRLWSEIFCYVALCSSAPSIKCCSIMIGGSEHLNCGLSIVW